MRYIRDTTGRFPERPYFEPGELDELCERKIEKFLLTKYGAISYPIPTDALEILLEQHDVVLDCYADLSAHGEDTDGVTEFRPDLPTRVCISRALSENPARENRFRTTLAHEFGHVILHGPIYRAASTGDLFESQRAPQSATCTRRTVVQVRQTDWLEWQAGYVSGALLMPISRLRNLAKTELDGAGQVPIDSATGQDLVKLVAQAFRVSRQAAEVRLQQAGLLVSREVSSLL